MKKFILLALLMICPLVGFGQTAKVNIYLGSKKFNPGIEDCSKVYPVSRRIPKKAMKPRATLLEFFKGTTRAEEARGYFSLDESETKGILKSIKVKDNAAYINFTRAVYKQLGKAASSCGGSFFFTSIEKSMYQFSGIKKVFYAIEGSPKSFYDWVQAFECPAELKNCSSKNFR